MIKSEQGDNVTPNLRSGLLGGLISSVIWMIISTAVGMGKGPVIIGGLAFLIGTWLITTAISTIIARRRSGSSAH
jgi:riboflavin transporter FmnP